MRRGVMSERVHIFGASGSGTSTLGREIAGRYGRTYFEADDFFWQPTNPPYQHVRERSDRQQLLIEALAGAPRWVLAGSVSGWGDVAIDFFDLAVFVITPTDIRLERLRVRESARFGNRLLETGDMHHHHKTFMAWASQYDEGSKDMRSRRQDEEWVSRLPCTVARVDGSLPVEVLCDQLSAAFAA
jgi:adenylate kinase family enzyme